MRLQKFVHACVLVETGDARILLDPGSFSKGFESLEGLTAIMLTHQHADHLDIERLKPLLDRNASARLIADRATAQQLRDDHGIDATVATAGDRYDVGTSIDVVGELHAEIHRDIPRIPNVGYVIDGRLFHPGDALTESALDVEVLLLPTAAPWMRMAEAIDFYRAVAPRVAVPIHEAMTTVPELYYGALRGLGPQSSELRVLDDGEPSEV